LYSASVIDTVRGWSGRGGCATAAVETISNVNV
jgi:hypothetical protein